MNIADIRVFDYLICCQEIEADFFLKLIAIAPKWEIYLWVRSQLIKNITNTKNCTIHYS
ncbi:hypothetical protein [Nostoc sp. CCY 9925]|uniref:hypothetical protein n=1 Tax=Nostoc sp. CCY 9925 TaxID=3103865 RepID=UPI0039C6A804